MRTHAQILSVDSMQVYRGMDIGTAKPSAAERARVVHHLIDVLDVSESFDAAQFVQLAEKAVPNALAITKETLAPLDAKEREMLIALLSKLR